MLPVLGFGISGLQSLIALLYALIDCLLCLEQIVGKLTALISTIGKVNGK